MRMVSTPEWIFPAHPVGFDAGQNPVTDISRKAVPL